MSGETCIHHGLTLGTTGHSAAMPSVLTKKRDSGGGVQ